MIWSAFWSFGFVWARDMYQPTSTSEISVFVFLIFFWWVVSCASTGVWPVHTSPFTCIWQWQSHEREWNAWQRFGSYLPELRAGNPRPRTSTYTLNTHMPQARHTSTRNVIFSVFFLFFFCGLFGLVFSFFFFFYWFIWLVWLIGWLVDCWITCAHAIRWSHAISARRHPPTPQPTPSHLPMRAVLCGWRRGPEPSEKGWLGFGDWLCPGWNGCWKMCCRGL